MNRRDVFSLISAFILLAAATAVVAELKDSLTLEDWGSVVILVIAPLVIYGVLSGRLLEISAPGGWAAKFREEAHATVDFDQAAVDLSTQDMQLIPKESVAEVKRRVGLIRDGRPIVLTLTVARGASYYTHFALLDALKAMAPLRNFKFVLILDQESRAIAYIPTWALRSALERPDPSGAQFVAAINAGRREEIIAFPGVLTEFVTSSATNTEALNAMERLNLEALVAIDKETRQPRGVVERDRVLSKMMLALAGGGKRQPAA